MRRMPRDVSESSVQLSLGKSKWGLSNGGIRPLSAICSQSSTIVHFYGPFGLGPFLRGNFRHKMTTIIGNRGQLWTTTLSPHLLSPHFKLDLTDICSCDFLVGSFSTHCSRLKATIDSCPTTSSQQWCRFTHDPRIRS